MNLFGRPAIIVLYAAEGAGRHEFPHLPRRVGGIEYQEASGRLSIGRLNDFTANDCAGVT